jgi:hypothetical protein
MTTEVFRFSWLIGLDGATLEPAASAHRYYDRAAVDRRARLAPNA